MQITYNHQRTKMYDNYQRKRKIPMFVNWEMLMRSRVKISFCSSQERDPTFSYFSTTFFRIELKFFLFCLLVNIMSYVYVLFVYNQYLCQQINWLCSLIFPIVQTVNKSPDLLAGFWFVLTFAYYSGKGSLFGGNLVMFS